MINFKAGKKKKRAVKIADAVFSTAPLNGTLALAATHMANVLAGGLSGQATGRSK